ncbi:MAG: PCRF domain-containing protein [Eubacteriales bacterium]
MLDAGGLDKDFREMVEQELNDSRKQLEVIADELKILLLPKDPNDDRNVIVEIRGGAGGGEEAALLSGVLFRKVQHVCRIQRLESGSAQLQ